MDRINDLLKIDQSDIDNVRVKLNVYNGTMEPIDDYLNAEYYVNNDWLLWHNQRRYFEKGQIAICLVRLKDDPDLWLLTTIVKIVDTINVSKQPGYDVAELSEYNGLYGKLVIKYHNKSRCIGRRYASIMDELMVYAVLDDKYTGGPITTH